MTKNEALKLLSKYDASLVVKAIERIQIEEERKQEQMRRTNSGIEKRV